MSVARICDVCKRVCSPTQPDPCLGELPGVSGACCGHGSRTEAFIGWADGPTIRGFWVDEQWDARVVEWRRERQDARTVTVSFEVYREALDGVTNDDLQALGELVVSLARDRVPEYCRLVPVRA